MSGQRRSLQVSFIYLSSVCCVFGPYKIRCKLLEIIKLTLGLKEVLWRIFEANMIEFAINGFQKFKIQ
jgi:hypothetical protein